MVKCGFFKYEEFPDPFRVIYSCNYFSTISNTEHCLCQGCYLDSNGIPHLDILEDD